MLEAERGNVAAGVALIRRACAADARNAEANAQLGRWLSKLHRTPEAIEAVEHALAQAPADAVTLDTIGVVFSRAGLHERAATCFERAVALEPGRASLQFNLAMSLKFLGRFDAAEATLERCLQRDPRHWQAHSELSQLQRQTPERNHVPRLRACLGAPDLDVDAELLLRHALAKELDDLGEPDEAFEQLQAGKARRRAALGYDFGQDRVLFETVTRLFPQALPPLPQDIDSSDAPIFVVGMPRTGTTLVERVLSSHPLVASAGESQNFGVLLKRATATPPPRVLDESTLLRSLDVDLAALGKAYVAATRPSAGMAATTPAEEVRPRFVDKLPLNFFYFGHIARALPGASLVVLRRHPLDTCLANFRQLFATGMSYYDYAYDLRDIARYYASFHRLMAHWRNVLPGRLLELEYETLVREPRREIERLLAHCRLPWDERCLGFEHNPSAVATASAVQVRQPLYASSIGRWRRYSRQLEPAAAQLLSEGVELNR